MRSARGSLQTDTAAIRDGELVCDGRERISRAFYLPCEWADVSVRAKFLGRAGSRGRAGLRLHGARVADAANDYYVDFDRTQAILVRVRSAMSRGRSYAGAGGLEKPAGQWQRVNSSAWEIRSRST